MINSEIRILLDENSTTKAQGDVLEKLVKWVLQAHQYEVKENLHFTALEIDLIAKHKHKNETLYVECKAKDKVSSAEIKNFLFNVLHKKPDYGYFIRTKEIEQQAGALIEELKDDSRYRNVSFFEPEQLIKILKESNFVNELENIYRQKVTKRILCLTYKGDFFVYVINDSSILPTSVIIVDAHTKEDVLNEEILSLLSSKIIEITNLKQEVLQFAKSEIIERKSKSIEEIENISEVQASTKWYDYLPASSKHFVGREQLRNQLFDFFKDVSTNNSEKRVFYLTGKSGWGKSSLMVEVKERCRNQFYKNRFFSIAIDSRSATSDNFVALSFERLIRNASKSGFIGPTESIEFVSNVDLFKSESIKGLLDLLSSENKYLILIFDQFEDVFRKGGLFKSFYKFLSDVTDLKSNIIIGFSWKTEILIPSDNEAYHYWQQAKEQAIQFTVPEFGRKEIVGIIKQLEKSTSKIVDDLERRIKENSQGLPWLTKKLCIHIYDQLQLGLSQEQLIDENLNIEDLFKSDLEKLDGPETEALKYIAKRAYDGNFFEVSELGDKIQEKQVDSLRDKRLIIRSGANYNIYWDIFRDYLVTKEVPQIGEAFLLRYGINACLAVFLLFSDQNKKYTLDDLKLRHPKGINKATLENILIELRNIGLIKKIDNSDTFILAINGMSASEDSLKKYIKEKFKNYSPYLKMVRYESRSFSSEDVEEILKNVFKGILFKEKTWMAYSNVLIGWFKFAELKIATNISTRKKGRNYEYNIDEPFLRNTPKDVVKALDELLNDKISIKSRMRRDLQILNLIDKNGVPTNFAFEINNLNDYKEIKEKLKQEALKLTKMNTAFELLSKKTSISAKSLIDNLPNDFFGKQKTSTKVIYATIIKSWFSENNNFIKTDTDNNKFLYSTLPAIIKALNKIQNQQGKISRHEARDLRLLNLVDNDGYLNEQALIILQNSESIIQQKLRNLVLLFPKYKIVNDIIVKHPKMRLNQLYTQLPDNFFNTEKVETQKVYLGKIRSWLILKKGNNDTSLNLF